MNSLSKEAALTKWFPFLLHSAASYYTLEGTMALDRSIDILVLPLISLSCYFFLEFSVLKVNQIKMLLFSLVFHYFLFCMEHNATVRLATELGPIISRGKTELTQEKYERIATINKAKAPKTKTERKRTAKVF